MPRTVKSAGSLAPLTEMLDEFHRAVSRDDAETIELAKAAISVAFEDLMDEIDFYRVCLTRAQKGPLH